MRQQSLNKSLFWYSHIMGNRKTGSRIIVTSSLLIDVYGLLHYEIREQ